MKSQCSGMALMLVIWALVLMSSLATGFALGVRHEIRVAGDLASMAHAEAAAVAALHKAVLEIASPDRERPWQADSSWHRFQWDQASVAVQVQAENGRIDLNRAPHDLLMGLFEQILPDADHQALLDAVLDWRDPDDRSRPEGAEEREYSRAGYPYGPPNRPFRSLNELSQVLGFDRSQVAALLPYLTIYSRSNRIHAASADLAVLAAIPGIEREDAESFVLQRDLAQEEDEADDGLDLSLLGGGSRYLIKGFRAFTYSLIIEVRMADGLVRRERVVIQLRGELGFTVLARQSLPAHEMVAQRSDSEA